MSDHRRDEEEEWEELSRGEDRGEAVEEDGRENVP